MSHTRDELLRALAALGEQEIEVCTGCQRDVDACETAGDCDCDESLLVRTPRLDALEAAAVRAIRDTYGPLLNDAALFWAQKGIEGMRLALAREGK